MSAALPLEVDVVVVGGGPAGEVAGEVAAGRCADRARSVWTTAW